MDQLMRNMRNKRSRLQPLIVTLTLVVVLTARADDDVPDRSDQVSQRLSLPGSKIGLPQPSLDSVIAWTDQYYFHDWRIQAHVESGECRLLDVEDEVRCEGSFERCLAQLEAIRREQHLPPMSGKAVVLLHGLAAPRWSMKLLARHLENHGGYNTFVLDYASLRSNIDNHASSLANVIRSLEGIDQIHLVGHSLGNIVIRRYLAGNDSEPHTWKADPRIGRIVMIGPPNHGSITATRLSDTTAFQVIFGDSGLQLGMDWDELEQRLAVPRHEFGIIAGGMRNSVGMNPFLPGDDDGRITVTTTRLAGARDFLVVPALHEFIANDPRVFKYTLRFLNEGYFVSRDQQQSIPYHSVADRPGSRRSR